MMTQTPHFETLSVSSLLLDTENPRLPDIQKSQPEAIRSMTVGQSEKILRLAEHIVAHGLNPASYPIVMPFAERSGFYVVLDGNRRITALKLLETPTLADGGLRPHQLNRLKQMAANFAAHPISDLECVVVVSRDDADVWIKLIHRGQQDGAGLVEWDGQVGARYDARRSASQAPANGPALQLLDYAKDRANLSEQTRQRIEEGKFPITSLTRLLGTPYVRSKLGIDIKNGTIVTQLPEAEVVKGVERVIEDIGSGEITVSDLKRQPQRIDYINGFKRKELPDVTKLEKQEYTLGEAAPSSPIEGAGKSKPVRGKSAGRIRKTLIPVDCRLSNVQGRVRAIYQELRKLDLDHFPNAGAILLRVFLELSLDHFIEKVVKSWPQQQLDNAHLSDKVMVAANYMENNGHMTKEQVAPARKAGSGQGMLVTSVKSMNAYVHSRYYSPVPSELKVTWDDLQPFVEKLWSLS